MIVNSSLVGKSPARRHPVGIEPVREVAKRLVLEGHFDSIHFSKRQKPGTAMSFPSISRVHADEPVAKADTIETLKNLVT